jgi:hypothetical protein
MSLILGNQKTIKCHYFSLYMDPLSNFVVMTPKVSLDILYYLDT